MMLLLSLLSGGSILFILLKFSAYGLDFTDEGFYLVCISNPYLYEVSLSQFGFIYHPLYNALSGNIANLRIVNIIVTYLLAWCLFALLFHSQRFKFSDSIANCYLIAAGFAMVSLCGFCVDITTPNYNTLTLQSLLSVSIGILLAEKSEPLLSLIGVFLVGISGCLLFMAKPSSALALALVLPVYFLLAKSISFWKVFLSAVIACAGVIFVAMMIDGSVFSFIERMKSALYFQSLLESGHGFKSILRLGLIRINNYELCLITGVAALTFLLAMLMVTKVRALRLSGFLIQLIIVFFVVGISMGWVTVEPGIRYERWLLFGVVLGGILFCVYMLRRKIISCLCMKEWMLLMLFLIMPYIYAFGTNNSYFLRGTYSAVFWISASVILLVALMRENVRADSAGKQPGIPHALLSCAVCLLPFVLVIQLVAAIVVSNGIDNPYRQPQSLRLNDRVVTVGPDNASLILDEGFANYIDKAKTKAFEAGFKAGDGIIDLTGRSPGLLFVLGAKNTGSAWILGGYKGSNNLSRALLKQVSCRELSNAWVLLEEDGRRSISVEVLDSFGVNLSHHYHKAGRWETAKGADRHIKFCVQLLFKPNDPEQLLSTCRLNRETVSDK